MNCKSFDGALQCQKPATVTVFWPGQTTYACDMHHAGMQRVARVMGFPLDSRPIEAEKSRTD